MRAKYYGQSWRVCAWYSINIRIILGVRGLKDEKLIR